MDDKKALKYIENLFSKAWREEVEEWIEYKKAIGYDFINDIEDMNASHKEIIQRQKDIDNSIKQHALGVQSVYNEFAAIKNLIASPDIDKKISQLKEAIEITKDINVILKDPKIEYVRTFMGNFMHNFDNMINTVKEMRDREEEEVK
jgi:hypothetical protein